MNIQILARIADLLLTVVYGLGAISLLFSQFSKEFGYVSLGILLLAIMVWGQPYYTEREGL